MHLVQEGAYPRVDAYRELREPREIKAFGDPLRLRILHLLVERPATNQRVADELGEPPAKVYHHLTFLLDAGLIELVETRISGRNVEKFYRAVARTFLLRPGVGLLPESELASLDAVLDRVRHDALDSAAAWADQPPRVLRRVASLPPQQVDAFHEQLRRLIQDFWTDAEEQGGDASQTVLTVLTYRAAQAVVDESEASQEGRSDAG